MRKNRVNYGTPVYWTLSSLMNVLHRVSLSGVPGDTLILMDGCDCCSSLNEGGASVSDSFSKKGEKVITVRKKAGFEDDELEDDDRAKSRALDEFANEQLKEEE